METGSLAVLVRSRREQLRLTQEQLALLVQVSRSEISEIEAGRVRQPRAHVFARLGRALGLPAAALLGALGYASGDAAGMDAEDLMLMATALVQVAGAERSWLRERLNELGDLLVARQSSRAVSPSRGSRSWRSRAAR